MNFKDAIIVVHPMLTPIANGEIEAALGPAAFGPGARLIRLKSTAAALEELADLDWGEAHDTLAREFQREVAPALVESPGPVIYLGMSPIPVAIELGRRIGPTRRIVAHQQRHDTKSWAWPVTGNTVEAKVTGIPGEKCLVRGDVVIRVSCSHPVSIDDTRAAVPQPIGEIHVSVAEPHEDVLRSHDDALVVAKKFGEALDSIERCFPRCETVHVFAAVPPAVALLLGAELNPTIHDGWRVQTYQFANGAAPRYRPALTLGDPPPAPLSPEMRGVAATTRAVFAEALSDASLLATALARGNAVSQVFGADVPALPAVFSRIGLLGKNPAIVGAGVSTGLSDESGEFSWDPDTKAWTFDDHLVAALGARLNGNALRQAARLFFLHEAVHIAAQGLTSATAARVGRLPRVLEEADYVADLWAVLHEYMRAALAGEVQLPGAASFFKELLKLMTTTFWAFDAGALPLRFVQVRRLNRYLTWYWLRLCMERAGSLGDVLRTLAAKPVLEVSGPRVVVTRNRVWFDLDPKYSEAIELGALVAGVRVVRVGDRPGASVSGLLAAIRVGDEKAFVAALRGIFDSIEREE